MSYNNISEIQEEAEMFARYKKSVLNLDYNENPDLILIIEKHRDHNYLNRNDEDDDYIEFTIVDNLGFYLRRDCSSFPPSFIINTKTLEIIEFDHGLKGGYYDIKIENNEILAFGQLAGNGKAKWYKYTMEGILKIPQGIII